MTHKQEDQREAGGEMEQPVFSRPVSRNEEPATLIGLGGSPRRQRGVDILDARPCDRRERRTRDSVDGMASEDQDHDGAETEPWTPGDSGDFQGTLASARSPEVRHKERPHLRGLFL